MWFRHVSEACDIGDAAERLLHNELKTSKGLELRLMGVKLSEFHRMQTGEGTIDRFFGAAGDGKEAGSEEGIAYQLSQPKALEGGICPVCGQELSGVSNDRLNAHIDLCLSEGSSSRHQQGPAKGVGIEAFFASRQNPRPTLDPEVLDALPDDVRREVLEQHATGRKRKLVSKRGPCSKKGTLTSMFAKQVASLQPHQGAHGEILK